MIHALELSPSQRLLASAGTDKSIKVWSTRTGDLVVVLADQPHSVHAICWISETQLASSTAENAVRIWDLDLQRCTHVLRDHSDAVWALAANGAETLMASASYDKSALIWSLPSLTKVRRITLAAGCCVAVFHPQYTSKLALGLNSGNIEIHEPVGLEEVRVLRGHAAGVLCLAISMDGLRVVSGSSDHIVKVWSWDSGVSLHSIRHSESVFSVRITSEDTTIFSVSLRGAIKANKMTEMRAVELPEPPKETILVTLMRRPCYQMKTLRLVCLNCCIKMANVSLARLPLHIQAEIGAARGRAK
eukprot:TRINITY_DN10396_c0_g1_i5.p1 TRINITY_DN10396_c0_g1~~TRINITY_DN10396_c0_g1_i5.p1  ORF type:complete len:327 (-),score=45.90 TRINITY_DN10396_c0_g1_i5:39-947(-)